MWDRCANILYRRLFPRENSSCLWEEEVRGPRQSAGRTGPWVKAHFWIVCILCHVRVVNSFKAPLPPWWRQIPPRLPQSHSCHRLLLHGVCSLYPRILQAEWATCEATLLQDRIPLSKDIKSIRQTTQSILEERDGGGGGPVECFRHYLVAKLAPVPKSFLKMWLRTWRTSN